MIFRIFSGIVALALVLAFVIPPVLKLKDPALTIVILIGIVLMFIDLFQSLRERE